MSNLVIICSFAAQFTRGYKTVYRAFVFSPTLYEDQDGKVDHACC